MILVVMLAGALLGGGVWLVTAQVTSLAGEVPKYTDNIKGKVKSLRHLGRGSITSGLEKMIQEISGEWNRPAGAGRERTGQAGGFGLAAADRRGAGAGEPPGWRNAGLAQFSVGDARRPGLGPGVGRFHAAEARGSAQSFDPAGESRPDHRDDQGVGRRGPANQPVPADAVDRERHGRSVGGLGLLAIGVQYAFLWGFVAAVFRYIPYIGIWIAALPPIILSLAMFEGWVQPLLVIGLFLAIELFASNVAEPRLYGHSIGVSEVALLVAAAFWAFLWGPIGLVLSSPLTVCLVVLGKYVPQLKFLDVLLGDEPPLDAHVTFYQRLLARDQDEATQLVLAQAKASSPEQVYDDFLVPALNYAKRDRERDDLTDSDEQFVLQATREILEDLGERREAAAQAKEAIHPEDQANASAPIRLRILACPARDEADRLAWRCCGNCSTRPSG